MIVVLKTQTAVSSSNDTAVVLFTFDFYGLFIKALNLKFKPAGGTFKIRHIAVCVVLKNYHRAFTKRTQLQFVGFHTYPPVDLI